MTEIKGLDKLLRRMRSLPKQVAGPIAVKALRAAGAVAVRSIRSQCDPFVGQTIGFRLARRTSKTKLLGIVGTGVGQRLAGSAAWAPIQVSGSSSRFRRTKTGIAVSTGRIVGTNAVSRGVASAQSSMLAAMRAVLDREMKNLNK